VKVIESGKNFLARPNAASEAGTWGRFLAGSPEQRRGIALYAGSGKQAWDIGGVTMITVGRIFPF